MEKENILEDIVNNPSHYSENFSQEVLVTIIDWIKEFNDPIMGYLIGQHLKYIPRANKKDKKKGLYEDLEKSDFYWKELMEYIKSLKEGYKYIPKERGGKKSSIVAVGPVMTISSFRDPSINKIDEPTAPTVYY